MPTFGTHSLCFGSISIRNAIRWRKTGPSGPIPGVPTSSSAPACSNSPSRMPASPPIVYGIGGGSVTRVEISHRSSPSNVTRSSSSPIGPIDALATPKLSGSLAAATALPGVTTTGWSDVAPPNCDGSATRSAKREERPSAASSGAPARAVIRRPFSRAAWPSSNPPICPPSLMPQENEPLARFTVVPRACTLTAAPLLAIRGAGAPASAGRSIVTLRWTAGTIRIPFTTIGCSEYQRTTFLPATSTLRGRRQMPVALSRPFATSGSQLGSSSFSVIAASAVAPLSSVTRTRTGRLRSSTNPE